MNRDKKKLKVPLLGELQVGIVGQKALKYNYREKSSEYEEEGN